MDNDHLRLLLGFVLRPDSNCLDVGAHEGLWLSEFVRLAPRGKHMAYEPLPHLAGQLRQRFPSIAVRQKALSNSPGESDFVFVPEMPGYSGLRERHYPGVVTKQRIRVLTERLDDAWPRRRRLAVMIVDVEGAERLVFEGAIGTLRRSRPTIVFEHG
ncbi:MAG: FkbM family methyltransferase, partial [Candidatus Dormibacteraeota bacterium]|nr:FkbM family methyltransferase [Candidatus Dormibacteraeota bacterium]